MFTLDPEHLGVTRLDLLAHLQFRRGIILHQLDLGRSPLARSSLIRLRRRSTVIEPK
jgi:hypothetical protein